MYLAVYTCDLDPRGLLYTCHLGVGGLHRLIISYKFMCIVRRVLFEQYLK